LGVVRHHWRDHENADRPLVVEYAGYIVVGFGDQHGDKVLYDGTWNQYWAFVAMYKLKLGSAGT